MRSNQTLLVTSSSPPASSPHRVSRRPHCFHLHGIGPARRTRHQQNSENRIDAGQGADRGRVGRTVSAVGSGWGRPASTVIRSPGCFGRVAEWQTRWLQVPVSFGTWGFKSPFAHISKDRAPASAGVFLLGWSRALVAAGPAALVMPRCSHPIAARVRAPFPAGMGFDEVQNTTGRIAGTQAGGRRTGEDVQGRPGDRSQGDPDRGAVGQLLGVQPAVLKHQMGPRQTCDRRVHRRHRRFDVDRRLRGIPRVLGAQRRQPAQGIP